MKILLIFILAVAFSKETLSNPIYGLYSFADFMGGFFSAIGEEGDPMILSPCKQNYEWMYVCSYLQFYYYCIWDSYPEGTAIMMGHTLRKWNEFRDLYAPCTTDDIPVFQAALDAISSATPASLYAQFYDDPIVYLDLMLSLDIALYNKTDWEFGEALGILFRRLFFGLPERSTHI